MARFTEDTLNNWNMPPSYTEETKLQNAEQSVREVLGEVYQSLIAKPLVVSS